MIRIASLTSAVSATSDDRQAAGSLASTVSVSDWALVKLALAALRVLHFRYDSQNWPSACSVRLLHERWQTRHGGSERVNLFLFRFNSRFLMCRYRKFSRGRTGVPSSRNPPG